MSSKRELAAAVDDAFVAAQADMDARTMAACLGTLEYLRSAPTMLFWSFLEKVTPADVPALLAELAGVPQPSPRSCSAELARIVTALTN